MPPDSDFIRYLSELDLSQVAITAKILPNGKLEAVGGLTAKLLAACEASAKLSGLRQVVVAKEQPHPLAHQQRIEEGFYPRNNPFLEVLTADCLEEAVGKLHDKHGPWEAVRRFEETETARLPMLDGPDLSLDDLYQPLPLLREIKLEELRAGRSKSPLGPGLLPTFGDEALRFDYIQRYEEKVLGQEYLADNQGLMLEHLLRDFATLFPDRNPAPRFVVLGAPGSGKSVLIQWLCQHALRGEPPLLSGRKLPLRIRLRDWQQWASESKFLHCGLSDYAAAHFAEQRLNPAPHAEQMEKWLDNGDCLLLLDGLDEIIDEQGPFVEKGLNRVLKGYPECPLVLTCRTVRFEQYRSKLLDALLPVFFLDGLSDEQVRRYLAVYPARHPERFRESPLADLLLGNASMRLLAVNPMLLSIICFVVDGLPDSAESTDIPATRSRLYDQAVQTFLNRTDKIIDDTILTRLRDIGPSTGRVVLVQTAGSLFEDMKHLRHLTFEEKTLDEHQQEALRAVGRSGNPGNDAAALRHAWVLWGVLQRERRDAPGRPGHRPPAEPLYLFLHLTLQEYLTACWLIHEPDKAARKLLDRLGNGRWRESILMALGQLSTREELCEGCLLELLEADDLLAGLMPRAALLLVTALPEMTQVPDSVIRKAASQLLEAYSAQEKSAEQTVLRHRLEAAFDQLFASCHNRSVEAVLLAELTPSGKRLLPAVGLLRRAHRFSTRLAGRLLPLWHLDSADWGWPIDGILRDMASASVSVPLPPKSLREQLRARPELAERVRSSPIFLRLVVALYGGLDSSLPAQIAALRDRVQQLDQENDLWSNRTDDLRRTVEMERLGKEKAAVGEQLKARVNQAHVFAVERIHRDSPLSHLILRAVEADDPLSLVEHFRQRIPAVNPVEQFDALLGLVALGEDVAPRLRDDLARAGLFLQRLEALRPALELALRPTIAVASDVLREVGGTDSRMALINALLTVKLAWGSWETNVVATNFPHLPQEEQPRALAELWYHTFISSNDDPVYNAAVVLDTLGGRLAGLPETLVRTLANAHATVSQRWQQRRRWLLDGLAPRWDDPQDCLGAALEAVAAVPEPFGFVSGWMLERLAPLLRGSPLWCEAVLLAHNLPDKPIEARSGALRALLGTMDFHAGTLPLNSLVRAEEELIDPYFRARRDEVLLRYFWQRELFLRRQRTEENGADETASSPSASSLLAHFDSELAPLLDETPRALEQVWILEHWLDLGDPKQRHILIRQTLATAGKLIDDPDNRVWALGRLSRLLADEHKTECLRLAQEAVAEIPEGHRDETIRALQEILASCSATQVAGFLRRTSWLVSPPFEPKLPEFKPRFVTNENNQTLPAPSELLERLAEKVRQSPGERAGLYAEFWHRLFAHGGEAALYDAAVALDLLNGPLSDPEVVLDMLNRAQSHCPPSLWNRPGWRLDSLAVRWKEAEGRLSAALEAVSGVPDPFGFVRGWMLERLAPLLRSSPLRTEAVLLAHDLPDSHFEVRSRALRALLGIEQPLRTDQLLAMILEVPLGYARARAWVCWLRLSLPVQVENLLRRLVWDLEARSLEASQHEASTVPLLFQRIRDPLRRIDTYERWLLMATAQEYPVWLRQAISAAAELSHDPENQARAFGRLSRYTRGPDKREALEGTLRAVEAIKDPNCRADTLAVLHDLLTPFPELVKRWYQLVESLTTPEERARARRESGPTLLRHEENLVQAGVNPALLVLAALLQDQMRRLSLPTDLPGLWAALAGPAREEATRALVRAGTGTSLPLSREAASTLDSLLTSGVLPTFLELAPLLSRPDPFAVPFVLGWSRHVDPAVRRHAWILLLEYDGPSERTLPGLELLLSEFDILDDRLRHRLFLAIHGDRSGSDLLFTRQIGPRVLRELGRYRTAYIHDRPGLALVFTWCFERLVHDDPDTLSHAIEQVEKGGESAFAARCVVRNISWIMGDAWKVLSEGLRSPSPVVQQDLLFSICTLLYFGHLSKLQWHKLEPLLRRLPSSATEEPTLVDEAGAVVTALERTRDQLGSRRYQPDEVAELADRAWTDQQRPYTDLLDNQNEADLYKALADAGGSHFVNNDYRRRIDNAASRMEGSERLLDLLLDWLDHNLSEGINDPEVRIYPSPMKRHALLCVAGAVAERMPDAYFRKASKLPLLRDNLAEAVQRLNGFPGRQAALVLLGFLRRATPCVTAALRSALRDVVYVQATALDSLAYYRELEEDFLPALKKDLLGEPSPAVRLATGRLLFAVARNVFLDLEVRHEIVRILAEAVPRSHQNVYALVEENDIYHIKHLGQLDQMLYQMLLQLGGVADVSNVRVLSSIDDR